MDLLTIIISAIFATSTMTLFSYVVSWIFKKTYKEPVLLQFLMSNFNIKVGLYYREILSWYLHYFIGLVFIISFNIPLWIYPELYDFTLRSSLLFGCIIGTVGVIWWYIMFSLLPEKAPNKVFVYYLQLFIAHIIFGLTTYLIHWYLNEF